MRQGSSASVERALYIARVLERVRFIMGCGKRTRGRWQLWILLSVLVVGAVIQPIAVLAQSSSTTGGGITSPDTSDNYFSNSSGGTPAGPSTIVGTFEQATSSWITNITPIATSLFWALAGIDFTWTCITLVLQHDDLKSWMAGFIRKILTIGFFAALLQNGATWIADIVNFFISAGGTAGGVNISSMNASNIMGTGLKIAGDMLTGGPNASSSNTSVMSLFTNPVGNIASALIMDLGCLIILLCYVLIALHFVMAMVEAYITIGAGYIFLGFGGSRWTVPYTEKYLGMVIHAGVRIMVLEMMIGLGKSMAAEWDQMAITINNIPGILGANSTATVSGSFNGIQLLFALMSSIAIFAMCCWTVPQIAANVASGGLSMSGGDMVGAAAAAGTAAFAGASMAGGGSGGFGTGSQMGSSKDVESIAQASAMKGANMGIQLAMAAATGGGSAVAAGAVEVGAAAEGAASAGGIAAAAGPEASVVGLTPEAPSGGGGGSSNVDGAGGPVDPSTSGSGIGVSSGRSPDLLSTLHQGARGLESAIKKLPDDGGHMGGVTPKVDHGE